LIEFLESSHEISDENLLTYVSLADGQHSFVFEQIFVDPNDNAAISGG
jgi:hypothetical protein